MRTALAWLVVLAIVAAAFAPAPALGDGDPASDELIGANVFYPYSQAVDAGLQKTLNAEAAAASRAHFPLKVALIDSPADLGAVPSLFAKPQQYADFLDTEISFVGTKTLLLVVMPNGYGVHGLSRPATLAAASLAKPQGRRSDDIARAAILAVPKLAAAAGDPIKGLPAASGAGGGGAGGGDTGFEVGALVFVAVVLSALIVWLRHRSREVR